MHLLLLSDLPRELVVLLGGLPLELGYASCNLMGLTVEFVQPRYVQLQNIRSVPVISSTK